MLLKEGKWYERKNILWSIINGLVFVIGIVILGCGTYASVKDIMDQYASGKVGTSFSCDTSSYL